jgi:hypothetical protein
MQRVILLGASNLTYGFPLIVESLHATFGEVDLLAAHGHGRSYGNWSRVLGRSLPGIRACGLWEQLSVAGTAERPPLGLITDVGNDLLYGAEPEKILDWVDECAQRLRGVGAALTISGVPLESVKRMSAPRYHATRMCFFPGSGIGWPAMRRMIDELDAGLREIVARYEGAFVEPRREWYGVDPIHVSRRQRPGAWQQILSAWPGAEVAIRRPTLVRASTLWRLRPHQRQMFGREQHVPQPALQQPGLSLRLY